MVEALKHTIGRLAALTLVGVSLFSHIAFADVKEVRFSSTDARDRIVFDLDKSDAYQAELAKDDTTLLLTLPKAKKGFRRLPIKGARISSATYQVKKDKLLVSLTLRPGMVYEAHTLENPARIFVDVRDRSEEKKKQKTIAKQPAPSAAQEVLPAGHAGTEDGAYIETPAAGLTKTSLAYWDDRGQISAWILRADKSKYRLELALAKGVVPGVEPVSQTAARTGATAAINASYFAGNGDLIGTTRIGGKTAGTTYFTRSAMGIMPDGSTVFGPISYDGKVTMNGVTLDVSAVDAERGENGVVLYNSNYGKLTRTNEYGMEYTVQGGHVTHIQAGNSRIPEDGVVVSVHGTAMDAYAGADVRVGDPVDIREDLGAAWEKVPTVIGVGPRLVENGRVHVTASEEQFPSDIRVGRAPRSAVGVTKDGDYIIAVVDGRQSHSVGLTLTAWAELLLKYGAYNAINLDGGGSSELVINGEVQNSPSDGHERSVGASVVLLRR